MPTSHDARPTLGGVHGTEIDNTTQAKSPRSHSSGGGGRQAASPALSAADGRGGGRACGGICGFAGSSGGQRSVRLSANVDGGVTDGLRVDG